MVHNFQAAVDVLGKPGARDVEGYLSQVGIPAKGKPGLLHIPSPILKIMFGLHRLNRAPRRIIARVPDLNAFRSTGVTKFTCCNPGDPSTN